MFYCFT